jgi:glycosyltransferase involved in cell wall biosynthesis
MNIVLLNDQLPPDPVAGAGQVTFNLVKEYLRQGHQVTAITTTQKPNPPPTFHHQGVTIHQIYSHYHPRWRHYLSLYNPQTQSQLKNLIARIQPDVIHAHNLHSHLSYHSLKIARQFTPRVFLTTHDAMSFHYSKLVEPFKNLDSSTVSPPSNLAVTPYQQLKTAKLTYHPLRNPIIRHYLKNTKKIIAVSRALEHALHQNHITNTTVIHNGINPKDWQTTPSQISQFQTQHHLEKKPIILLVGRLSYPKGSHQALHALSHVTKTIPLTTLLIAGHPPSPHSDLFLLAKQLNLLDSIVFTGWLSPHQLKNAYHSCHVVLVPSLYLDPLPTVILEAMACKKPVVGTIFGGTPEIIQHQKTSYLVNPFNTTQIAKYLVTLLTRPEKAKALGLAGYQRLKNHFSLQKQTRNYLNLFNTYSPVTFNIPLT